MLKIKNKIRKNKTESFTWTSKPIIYQQSTFISNMAQVYLKIDKERIDQAVSPSFKQGCHKKTKTLNETGTQGL
jgi:hypothetical protein